MQGAWTCACAFEHFWLCSDVDARVSILPGHLEGSSGGCDEAGGTSATSCPGHSHRATCSILGQSEVPTKHASVGPIACNCDLPALHSHLTVSQRRLRHAD